MRIKRQPRSANHRRLLRTELARAARPETVKGRVCGPNCTIRCPRCGSSGCQCKCTPSCPHAPHALSDDPELHPIEPGIVGLVFEMKRLGVFTPCWSCEGHLNADGSLWKLPRLWFYCASPLHVRLLATGLSGLKHEGRLSASWQIVVTYSDPDNPETTFSLEPLAAPDKPLDLLSLQGDLAEIARSLHAIVSEAARNCSISR